MKKLILTLGAIFTFSLMTSTVYAGTINSYEQELINLAQGLYEYDGVDYQVAPAYIEKLIAYLSGKDVDLTAKQRDEAVKMAFNSVAQGIREGYLIPAEQATEDTSIKVPEEKPEEMAEEAEDSAAMKKGSDTESKVSANVVKGSTKVQEGSRKDQANSGKVEADKSTDRAGNAVGAKDGVSEKEAAGSADKQKLISEGDQGQITDRSDARNTKEIEETTTEQKASDVIEQAITVPSEEAQEQRTGGSDIIKNTGYDLSITVFMMIGMGMLMTFGMYVTFRYNLFAQRHEE